MTDAQPMKMAAAEAAYQNTSDFSVLTIGNKDGSEEVWALKIPGMLGFLGNGKWGSQVKGINELKSYQVHEYTDHRKDGSQLDDFWTKLISSMRSFLSKRFQ